MVLVFSIFIAIFLSACNKKMSDLIQTPTMSAKEKEKKI